eukprot:291444_1
MYWYFGQGATRFEMNDMFWLFPRYFKPSNRNSVSFQVLSNREKIALKNAIDYYPLKDKQFTQFSNLISGSNYDYPSPWELQYKNTDKSQLWRTHEYTNNKPYSVDIIPETHIPIKSNIENNRQPTNVSNNQNKSIVKALTTNMDHMNNDNSIIKDNEELKKESSVVLMDAKSNIFVTEHKLDEIELTTNDIQHENPTTAVSKHPIPCNLDDVNVEYNSELHKEIRIETHEIGNFISDDSDSVLLELENIINQQFEEQFISHQYNGAVTCPSSQTNNQQSPTKNAPTTTRVVANNSERNNDKKKQNEQYDDNDKHDGHNGYNGHINILPAFCNHLSICDQCAGQFQFQIQQRQFWQHHASFLQQEVRSKSEYHLSFQTLLSKAVQRSCKKNKKNNKKRKSKSNQFHVRQNDDINSYAIQSSIANVFISHQLSKEIIPKIVKVQMSNVRAFMHAVIEQMKYNDEMKKDVVIKDFGFNHKDTNEILYCQIQKQNHPKYERKVEDKLFTQKDLQLFDINLPRFRGKVLLNIPVEISNKLTMGRMQNMFKKCPWNKIPIYNRKNNSERLMFSITKEKLMSKIINDDETCMDMLFKSLTSNHRIQNEENISIINWICNEEYDTESIEQDMSDFTNSNIYIQNERM